MPNATIQAGEIRAGGTIDACRAEPERPLRILVLNPEYPPVGGGASPVGKACCKELVALGHQVDLVTMGFRNLPRFEEEEERLRIFRVPSLRRSPHISHLHELLTYVASAFVAALRLSRKTDYDLVHAHFFFPSGLVAFFLRLATGIPYVVTAHGSDVPGYNPDRFQLLHTLFKAPWSLAVRGATLVTSPSRFLAGLIEKNLNGRQQHIEIVPYGIQTDWIKPSPKTRSILLVSRLFERKGVQFLLEALQQVETGHEIHIVGDGPYREKLEELARDVSDTVIFHGWIDNHSPKLAQLYSEASIFVFPSTSENFPVCLLEAMLAGAAVLSSDLEACFEVLDHTARFFPVGDVGALRDQLFDLTSDPGAAEELGEIGRQRALDNFTWDRVGREYARLFADVASSCIT